MGQVLTVLRKEIDPIGSAQPRKPAYFVRFRSPRPPKMVCSDSICDYLGIESPRKRRARIVSAYLSVVSSWRLARNASSSCEEC